MDVRTKRDGSESRLQDERDALLARALERPGVREVMRVYEDWKQADKAVEPYRTATRPIEIVTNRSDTREVR